MTPARVLALAVLAHDVSLTQWAEARMKGEPAEPPDDTYQTMLELAKQTLEAEDVED